MRCRPGTAFDHDPTPKRLQFRSDFRDNSDARFFGSGLREDTDDDRHAKLSQTLSVRKLCAKH